MRYLRLIFSPLIFLAYVFLSFCGFEIRRIDEQEDVEPASLKGEVGNFDDDPDPWRRIWIVDLKDHELVRKAESARSRMQYEPTVDTQTWYRERRVRRLQNAG